MHIVYDLTKGVSLAFQAQQQVVCFALILS